MNNIFILRLRHSLSHKKTKGIQIIVRLISYFNKYNNYLQLSFKSEALNDLFSRDLALKKRNFLIGETLNLERAINIYHLLSQVIVMQVPGEIVEAGCFQGVTALMMQMTLNQYQSEKILHVYDSFQGVPEPMSQDGHGPLRKGSLCTTKADLEKNFNHFNVKLPAIHAGWFKDTLPTQLPSQIAFAHLDGDMYSSIKESLEYIYPRLSKNAIVVVDDYCDATIQNVPDVLPGVKVACDEFLKDKPEEMHLLIAGSESHGYFRKV